MFFALTIIVTVQSAQIIPINAAYHLDSNRNLLFDISSDVINKDDIWSEYILPQEYIRITFPKPIGKTSDITVLAKTTDSRLGYIEIFRENGLYPIATIDNIDAESIYRAYLTGLHDFEVQSTFDLRIRDATMIFDWITDPSPPGLNFTYPTPENGTEQAETNVEINVSIDTDDLRAVKLNWNGTNYTLFDDSVVFFMNMDNRSSLGENNTYVVDVSGQGNNGTITGNATWNSSGKFNGAYYFDDTSGYILVPDDPILSPYGDGTLDSGMTVSFWMYAHNLSEDDQYVVARGTGGNTEWTFQQKTTDLRFDVYNYYRAHATAVLTPGWHHVVGILNYKANGTGNATLYLDGELVATDTTNSTANATYHAGNWFYIGGPSASSSYDGLFDEIMIINRTITQEELNHYYMSNLYKYNYTHWYLYINKTLNASAGLVNGIYDYRVFAGDSSAENSTEQRTITINTAMDQAPTSNLVTPLNNNVTKGTVVFNCSAMDDYGLSNVTIYIWNSTDDAINTNTSNITGTANSTTFMYSFSQDGNYSWNCLVRDNSTYGYSDWASSNYTLVIDSVSPIVYLESPANNTLNDTSSQPTFVFNATDERISALSCSLWLNDTLGNVTNYGTNSSVLNYTFTQLVPISELSNGDYYWWVNCSDFVNSNVSEIRNISIQAPDLGFPLVDTVYPVNGTNYLINVSSFNYSASDNIALDACWFSTDEGGSNSTAISAGTNFSDVSSVDGWNNWTVYCNDTSGNTNSSIVFFFRDNVHPQFSGYWDNSGISSGGTALFNVTVENTNGTVLLEINGANYTATNLTSNLYNVSVNGLVTNDYSYYWHSWSNSTLANFNTSSVQTFSVPMNVSFVPPTPWNQSMIYDSNITINATLLGTDFSSVVYNWNGTNYTIYDDSVILMMNFDNLSVFGENDSHVFDVSGNGNNGTVNGNVTWNSSGKYGGAFEFDGAGDYISIPYHNLSKITYSMWFKQVDPKREEYIFNYMRTAIRLSDGLVRFYNNVTAGSSVTWSGSWSSNTWTHLATTFNGTHSSIYINGSLVSGPTAISNGWNTNNVNNNIGSTGASAFNGSIDDVRIWNRSLTAGEVNASYMSGLRKYDVDKWNLLVDQQNSDRGNFTYYVWANNSNGDSSISDVRSVEFRGIYVPKHLHLTWNNGNATNTTMIVSWRESTNDTTSMIKYSDSEGNCSALASNQTPETINMTNTTEFIKHAELTNLTPDTLYYFCISNEDGYSSVYQFRTAPSNGTNFTWLQCSDVQGTTGSFATLLGYGAEYEPLFLLFPGDLAENSSDFTWSEWFAILQDNLIASSQRLIPIIPSLGNHDGIGDTDLVFWKEYHELPNNEVYFYHDIGDVRVITLSSDYGGYLISNQTQIDFLNQSLYEANESGKWMFVQYHQSMWPTTEDHSNYNDLRTYWGTLFDDYHVHVAYEAHEHVYKRTYPMYNNNVTNVGNGTVFMTSIGGAPKHDASDNNTWYLENYDNDAVTILVSSIPPIDYNSSDNTTWMNITAINTTGNVFDSVLIPKGHVNVSATDDAPAVTLSYPPDNHFNDTLQFVNLSFNATVTDDYNIKNCSLWHNATAVWHLNQTQNVTGTSNTTSFVLNLTNVTFVWNIRCIDNASQVGWGINRTVILNYTYVPGVDNPPSVSLSYPPNNHFNDTSQYVNMTFNATVTDDNNIANCSLWHNATGTWHLNQTKNVTGTSNITDFNLTDLNDAIFVWNIQCYDNASQADWGSNRTAILNYTIPVPPLNTMINFTSPTPSDNFSQSNTSVEINISISSIDMVEMGFNWNGTNYSHFNESLILMMNFDNISSLGENDSHVTDVSVYGNNGTILNAVTLNSQGKHGKAYVFNGSTLDYINIADDDMFSIGDGTGNTTPITISAWINMSDATNFQIISKDYGANDEWIFFTSSQDELVFYATDWEGDYIGRNYDSALTSYEGQWIHVAAVYAGGTSIDNFKIYLNGQRVDDKSYVSSNATAFGGGHNTIQPVTIGRDSNGTIDEVRIWNRSLSDDEIEQHYYSNLRKINATEWNFYANQSNLVYGNYTYYGWAANQTGYVFRTETRNLEQTSDECNLTFANWSTSLTNWEETVTLYVNGTNCERRQVNITIYEHNGSLASTQPGIALIVDNETSVTWRAEWINSTGLNATYSFNASTVINPSNTVTSNESLNVSSFCNATCLSLRIGCGANIICGAQHYCGECVERKTQWEPIRGILEPYFGINETHWMYENMTYDFGFGPEPYRTGTDGPYTHYVDKEHPAATDDYNIYGTQSKPRLSLPSSLPAGSVVEIHGGTYSSTSSFTGAGNLTHPIFIRGINGSEPVVSGTWRLLSGHFIVENIDFDRKNSANDAIVIGDVAGNFSHISIRHNEIHNFLRVSGAGDQMIKMNYAHNSSTVMSNLTIFNNHIHHNGEGQGPNDVMSVWVGQNTRNVWVIDNNIHHSGGDSVPIMSSTDDDNPVQPTNIYIGRNVMHDDYENAIDIKTGSNVVISQNRMYNFGPEYGYKSYGSAIVFHGADFADHPHQNTNIWTIFNEIFNTSSDYSGISSFFQADRIVPFPDEIYFIGNVLHDCHTSNGSFEGKSAAFVSLQQNRVYWLNNLAYNCDIGGMFYGDREIVNATKNGNETMTIMNNIFGDRHSGSITDINIQLSGTNESINRANISSNILYEGSGPARIKYAEYDNGSVINGQPVYNFSDFASLYPNISQGFIESNPMHLDPDTQNFSLQAGSPAIDSGYNVSVFYDRFEELFNVSIKADYDGNPIIGQWDIGPFEYQGIPDVVLSYPRQNYVNDTDQHVNLTFNATVTDDNGLANCSLWHNATGTWHLNQTRNVTGANNITYFHVRLSNVAFLWNIQCIDNTSQSGWGSSNRSAILNYTAPANNNPPGDDGSSSGSSSWGGGDTTTPTVSNVWSVLDAGTTALLSITNEQIPIKEVRFVVKDSLFNVRLVVKSLGINKPEALPEPPGTAYGYIEATPTGFLATEISNIILKFNVNRTWIESNNIQEADVYLYRYTNQWDRLPTSFISGNGTTITYESITLGFSTFVIAGISDVTDVNGQNASSLCGNSVCDYGEIESCPRDCLNQSTYLCEPDSLFCLDNIVMLCSSDGANMQIVETCSYQCKEGVCIGNTIPGLIADSLVYVVIVMIIVVVAILIIIIIKTKKMCQIIKSK